jgi:hypothetical protein
MHRTMSSFAMPYIPAPLASADYINYFIAYKNSRTLPDETIARVQLINPVLTSHARTGKRRISLHLIAPPPTPHGLILQGQVTPCLQEDMSQYPHISNPKQHLSSLVSNLQERSFSGGGRMKRVLEDPDSFDSIGTHVFDWAISWVEGMCGYFLCADSTDDWDRAMGMMGINDEIRAAFAKPEHNTIRLI